jgi:hypothetical protein
VIKNGVPFDVAHALEQWELMAYAVSFAKLDNGDKEWDWDNMGFIDR